MSSAFPDMTKGYKQSDSFAEGSSGKESGLWSGVQGVEFGVPRFTSFANGANPSYGKKGRVDLGDPYYWVTTS